MANKKFKLRDLKVSRIALAGRGVNPHAHIVLAKAEDDEAVQKTVTSVLDTITEGLKETETLKVSATTEDFRDILSPDTLTSLETVIKSALSAQPLGEQMDIQELVDNLPQEVVDYVADLETKVETLTKSLEEAVKPADPEPDPIAKTIADLPEEAQEILKSTSARLEKAEKELEEVRVAKATDVWVAKARALDGVIEKPEEFGVTLREIADTKPELAAAVEAALQTAADRVAKGDLFKEVGSVGGATDTDSRIEAIAKAYIEADPKLSKAEATAKAWTDNPTLYDQHADEMRQKNR